MHAVILTVISLDVKLNLETKTVVGVIRTAHETGMNVSDFVSMLLNDYVEAADEFTWTTNLVSPADYNGSGYPVIIPRKPVLNFWSLTAIKLPDCSSNKFGC